VPAEARGPGSSASSARAGGQRTPDGSTSSPRVKAQQPPAQGGQSARGRRKGGLRRLRLFTAPLPTADVLGAPSETKLEDEAHGAVSDAIERTLASFGVPAEVVDVERGPVVTRYCVAPGYVERGGVRRKVKVSRITALRKDLALSLSAPAIRIEAPIPGRSVIGIEVPNASSRIVGLRDLVVDGDFRRVARRSGLALALGRDVSGHPVVADLANMPHLLIGGATGSGKSVCVDAVLVSLLMQNTPDTLRLVLIDPKRVELTRYSPLPHLVASVVTEVAEVIGALSWIAREMDRRYRAFAERGARDLESYNARSPSGEAPLPAMAVVIDELADLMLTAPVQTEPLLTRIAQLGRATGIHLVVATQRPSTDVVTGLIKANFPARIAFAVASSIDSRVILDTTGAEALLGRGDMLFQAPDAASPRRAQGAYVGDEEIERVVGFWHESHWTQRSRTAPWEEMMDSFDLPPEEERARGQRSWDEASTADGEGGLRPKDDE